MKNLFLNLLLKNKILIISLIVLDFFQSIDFNFSFKKKEEKIIFNDIRNVLFQYLKKRDIFIEILAINNLKIEDNNFFFTAILKRHNEICFSSFQGIFDLKTKKFFIKHV